MENPFNITKANDYTDFEIQDYWVDFFGDKEKIKPTTPMPILIKGSKGCGKTHMLKYFSYELQKIRYNDNLKILTEDKYIGIFMRCSALDSFRFCGKGLSEQNWNLIFSNYLELWFAQKLIAILLDFEIEKDVQYIFCQNVLNLFDKKENLEAENFEQLIQLLIQMQKDFDYETKNIGFRRNQTPNFELLLNAGSLIYGIPKIIKKDINQFKDVFFLYIVDEFENITTSQQRIFNTLYRERDFPGSFRIGGRLYAFTNFNTLGSGEENRKGSEYDLIILDEDRRNDEEKYKNFVVNICIKKLNNHNYNEVTSKIIFLNYFEKFDENTFLDKISSRANRIKDNHIKKLKSSLININVPEININQIIEYLEFSDSKLYEKVNYQLFYRSWKNNEDLLIASKKIHKECISYNKSKNKENEIFKILNHFKTDLIDQLARESSLDLPTYIDINNYIKMSSGTPRNFLNIIKESFDYEYFKENKTPFTDNNIISLNSQLKSLKKLHEWFFNTNRIPHINSEYISPLDFLTNLANYLKKLKFSNNPPECSINLFSFSKKFINKYSEIINILLNNSYLIESNERRGKNDAEKNTVYFINGSIAPKYDLAIDKRGVLLINDVISEALINNDTTVINKKISEYNAPFKDTMRIIKKTITPQDMHPQIDFPKND